MKKFYIKIQYVYQTTYDTDTFNLFYEIYSNVNVLIPSELFPRSCVYKEKLLCYNLFQIRRI